MSPRCASAGLSSLITTATALLLLGSCAALQPRAAQLQEDGTYRVACDKTLSDCLASFDKCHHGFEVVRATEERHRRGPEPPSLTVNSEAVLRCRQLSPIFGKAGQPPATTAPAGDKGAATACFPGATQSCLGPGACQGAQVCLANGGAYGPCDCGTAGAAPPAPPADAATPAPAAPVSPAPADAAPR